MSTVRTLALGALLVVGVAGVSGAQASSTPRTGPEGGWHRGPDGMGRRGPGMRRGGPEGGRHGGLRDLNLTEAQKTQIQNIHQKYEPQRKELRDRARPFMDAARTARQNRDTAAVRSNLEKARQVMQSGTSIRTQEQAEIRGVLTAEQRVKFDAREKELADRRAKFGENGPGKGWGRKGRGLDGPPPKK